MPNLTRRYAPFRVLLLFAVGVLVVTHADRFSHSAPFIVNAQRFDPYKNSNFSVIWDGRIIAGVAYVSPLRRSTEVVEHRDGGDRNTVRKSPGTTHFNPITIRRGLTHDTDFENWANKLGGEQVSLKDFRKDIVIQIQNEAGQVALSYKVFRCWVSEYEAWSELDADGTAVLMESITLEHEGWQRDVEIAEPAEPSVTEPQ